MFAESAGPRSTIALSVSTKRPESVRRVERRGGLRREQFKADMRIQAMTHIQQATAKPLALPCGGDEQLRDEQCHFPIGQCPHEGDDARVGRSDECRPRPTPRDERRIRTGTRCRLSLRIRECLDHWEIRLRPRTDRHTRWEGDARERCGDGRRVINAFHGARGYHRRWMADNVFLGIVIQPLQAVSGASEGYIVFMHESLCEKGGRGGKLVLDHSSYEG